MFWSVVGFIVLFVIMCKVTLGYGLVAIFGLGEYNIGGVPNSLRQKIGILVAGFVVGILWYQLFKHAPFHINFMAP